MKVDLRVEFSRNKNEDLLTYFWIRLFFKIEVFILTLWMVVMNFELANKGFL